MTTSTRRSHSNRALYFFVGCMVAGAIVCIFALNMKPHTTPPRYPNVPAIQIKIDPRTVHV